MQTTAEEGISRILASPGWADLPVPYTPEARALSNHSHTRVWVYSHDSFMSHARSLRHSMHWCMKAR